MISSWYMLPFILSAFKNKPTSNKSHRPKFNNPFYPNIFTDLILPYSAFLMGAQISEKAGNPVFLQIYPLKASQS